LVANGVDQVERAKFEKLQSSVPDQVKVLYQDRNLGYGVGANLGLKHLLDDFSCDLLAVSNDDVFSTPGMLSELVCGIEELKRAGHRPGAIGPVSNYVHGPQRVDLGQPTSFDELLFRVEGRHPVTANSVTETDILRGLFLLFDPECLKVVGGFDPRFGLGNFEDADHNLRCRLAGFSLWIADGAFLYHKGSQTFHKLGIDYETSMLRTRDLFWEKWQVSNDDDALALETVPEGVELYVSLAPPSLDGPKLVLGSEQIDVIHQATRLEFGVWVSQQLKGHSKETRQAIVDLLAA
jgi:GT2 family glycosyltransferase